LSQKDTTDHEKENATLIILPDRFLREEAVFSETLSGFSAGHSP
jgi:hypothetical protein